MQLVSDCYTPVGWDTARRVICRLGGSNFQGRTWISAILKHPLAYGEHRLRHFNSELFFVGVICVSEERERVARFSRTAWACAVIAVITLTGIFVAHTICGDALLQVISQGLVGSLHFLPGTAEAGPPVVREVCYAAFGF